MQQDIVKYWNVQPPFKAQTEHPEGSLEWYQSITSHRHQVVPYLRDWATYDAYEGKRILEIGCGAGTDLCSFAAKGAIVTGIDITDKAVELTRKRLDVEGLTGTVVKYDGNHLPFPDDSFDLVYSCGVLHHTPFMDDLFSEAHRVLRKGGSMKLMLYHRRSLLYYYSIVYLRKFKKGLVDLGREDVLSSYSEFRVGCPYTRCLTEGEVRDRLWFFEQVGTATDYCVYDTESERKVPGDHVMSVEKTGVPDIDIFFENFNRDVNAGADLRKYGWHLLVNAVK